MMGKVPLSFYHNPDTLGLAERLLGKLLFTKTDNNQICAGIISETEAYLGAGDKASHAWNNRKTTRTQTMFLQGGVAYVYLCYGIHHLFNIVTHKDGIPHAILIRGVIPAIGKDIMQQRNGKTLPFHLNGPGKLTKALGIHTRHDRTALDGDTIWLEDRNINIPRENIIVGPRIGVDYAGVDAALPYRFRISDPLSFKNKLL